MMCVPVPVGQLNEAVSHTTLGGAEFLHSMPPARQQIPQLAGHGEVEERAILHSRPVAHQRES